MQGVFELINEVAFRLEQFLNTIRSGTFLNHGNTYFSRVLIFESISFKL